MKKGGVAAIFQARRIGAIPRHSGARAAGTRNPRDAPCGHMDSGSALRPVRNDDVRAQGGAPSNVCPRHQ